jgi:opacity protein-like surface antigen
MRKSAFVCLALALLLSVIALAQDTVKPGDAKQGSTQVAAQEKRQPKPASPETTVTGCLQKGDEQGEFAITGEDGKSWDLHSTAVKLDEHIGHKVTVAGTITRESKAEEKKEGEVEKASGKQEYGDLRVTSLKMISTTCSK